MMKPSGIIVVGGGASGVFAALRCRECTDSATITIVEKNDRLLSKVSRSGGGRCNLTHTVTNIGEFVRQYPHGERLLHTAFNRFGPRETVTWFERNGVRLHAEKDGRIFPASNRSHTITDFLIKKLNRSRITVLYDCECRSISVARSTQRFTCSLSNGDSIEGDRILVATGGMQEQNGTTLFSGFTHTVITPVPSLFTFAITDQRIAVIPGVTVEDTVIALPKTHFAQRGPVLITHHGLSGPAILRLSAFAARYLHDCGYSATITINWCPSIHYREMIETLTALRSSHARSFVVNYSPLLLPARLWQSLVHAIGGTPNLRYANLTKQMVNDLAGMLHKSIFRIKGIDMNKKEFVTSGGISLKEIDPLTLQSRICNGLFFAGEVLDIDGVTGGFNLQAAWTTGWIAGSSMTGDPA